MNRRFLLNAMVCLMAYGATVGLLNPSSADAKHRRVLAGVGCHPDTAIRVDYAQPPGGLPYDDQFVFRAYNRVNRQFGSLYITDNSNSVDYYADGNGGDIVGVRCYVPTDSYLRHSELTEAHVSGVKNSNNGFASYVKACYLWYTNGSYTCGSTHYLPNGIFNTVIHLGNIWSDNARYPMITAVLKRGDKLYGIYYQD